jgi:hypothetical protein
MKKKKKKKDKPSSTATTVATTTSIAPTSTFVSTTTPTTIITAKLPHVWPSSQPSYASSSRDDVSAYTYPSLAFYTRYLHHLFDTHHSSLPAFPRTIQDIIIEYARHHHHIIVACQQNVPYAAHYGSGVTSHGYLARFDPLVVDKRSWNTQMMDVHRTHKWFAPSPSTIKSTGNSTENDNDDDTNSTSAATSSPPPLPPSYTETVAYNALQQSFGEDSCYELSTTKPSKLTHLLPYYKANGSIYNYDIDLHLVDATEKEARLFGYSLTTHEWFVPTRQCTCKGNRSSVCVSLSIFYVCEWHDWLLTHSLTSGWTDDMNP